MKKTTKLIAMLTVMTLLSGLAAAAFAEDRIFTSPVFSIPKDRVIAVLNPEPEPEPEPQPEVTEPEPEPEPEKPAKEEKPAEPAKPAGPVERKVKIYSSRKDTTYRDEFIYLTSELIGFGNADVHFQWQVDRNDGAGWQDVKDANGPTHTFVATKETVLYNWRLIVTTDD